MDKRRRTAHSPRTDAARQRALLRLQSMMLQALVVVEKPLGMLRTSAKQHKIRHDVYRRRCVRTMPRDHEPTFLELGPRKAPPVPVYGSPKQVITIRKLPARRDGNPKISFSLNFTAADGRKSVTL
jgi:hypothetical protein